VSSFTEISKLKERFREPKIKQVLNSDCICHACPHIDNSLCPENCETTSGLEIVCPHPPCEIRIQHPEECEKQIIRIRGKPVNALWDFRGQ